MCTLKTFPYLYQHVIAWVKEEFYTIFSVNINYLNNKYIDDKVNN